jgi:hypothetical protein
LKAAPLFLGLLSMYVSAIHNFAVSLANFIMNLASNNRLENNLIFFFTVFSFSPLYIRRKGVRNMAAQAAVTDMSLRLVLNGGTDEKGKAITKNKVYKSVKLDAQANSIHEVAVALASLQGYTLEAVQTISTSDVVQI